MGNERFSSDLIEAINHAREIQVKRIIEEANVKRTKLGIQNTDGIFSFTFLTQTDKNALAKFAYDDPERYQVHVNNAVSYLKQETISGFTISVLEQIAIRLSTNTNGNALLPLELEGAAFYIFGGQLPEVLVDQLSLVVISEASEAGIQEVFDLLSKKPFFRMTKEFVVKNQMRLLKKDDGSEWLIQDSIVPFISLVLLYPQGQNMPMCCVEVDSP